MKRDEKYITAYEKYLAGSSLAKITKALNVTRQSVYGAFKKRGLKLRSPNFQPHQHFNDKKFTLRCHGYFELTTGDRKLMHRYVWEFYNGAIPEKWDIHHKDENKHNNDISNLECLPKSEHTRKYSPHNNQYTKGRKRVTH